MSRQDEIDVVVAYNTVAIRKGRRGISFRQWSHTAARKLIRWCGERSIPPVRFVESLDGAKYLPSLAKLCDESLLTHWYGRYRFGEKDVDVVVHDCTNTPEIERRKHLFLLEGNAAVCRAMSHLWGGFNDKSASCQQCRLCVRAA